MIGDFCATYILMHGLDNYMNKDYEVEYNDMY